MKAQDEEKCRACAGSGRTKCDYSDVRRFGTVDEPCATCGGSGKRRKKSNTQEAIDEVVSIVGEENIQDLRAHLEAKLYPDAKPGCCKKCGEPFSDANVHTALGWKETQQSGWCEDCWDTFWEAMEAADALEEDDVGGGEERITAPHCGVCGTTLGDDREDGDVCGDCRREMS